MVLSGGGDDVVRCAGVLVPTTIGGGGGDDVLTGGSGDDSFSGGTDFDCSAPGLGDDPPLDGPDGNDRIDGGPGHNLVSYAARSDPLFLSLAGDPSGGAGESDVFLHVEELFGGSGDDLMVAGNFNKGKDDLVIFTSVKVTDVP